MSSSLLSIPCVPCQGGEPPLVLDEINKFKQEIHTDWKLVDGPYRLRRDFGFQDFKTAINFINEVGDLAEAEGHHPNIRLHDYKFVEIELYTHKIAGLHKNDYILAAKIDELNR